MIQLPLEYQSGDTFLAELNPDYYITDKKRVVAKLTAENAWIKPITRIAPIDFVEISDNRYKEENEPYERFQALLNGTIEKHRLGEHDQSRHGRRKVSAVASNIDLDGKRFSEAEGEELAKKVVTLTNLRDSTHDRLTQEILGKKWEDLPPYGTEKVATPDALKGTSLDEDGLLTVNQYTARDPDFWAMVDADSAVVAARAEVEESYLWKEMMNLESQSGSRMGDNPDYVKDMLHSAQFFGAEDTPMADVQKVIDDFGTGNSRIFVRDQKIDVTGNSFTPAEVVASADSQWKEYIADSTPTVLVSASVAQQVVSQEKVKTIWETGKRPARAGQTSDRYMDRRAMYENLAFGYDDSNPVNLRSVSGTLTNGTPYYEVLAIYGGKNTAAIDLKPSTRERTTFTTGDSLNTFGRPESLISPKGVTIPTRQAIQATFYQAATGRNYYKDYEFNFPEIQVHGGITLGDIAGVRFFGNPSANVLSTLDRKGVPYTIERMPTDASEFGQTD